MGTFYIIKKLKGTQRYTLSKKELRLANTTYHYPHTYTAECEDELTGETEEQTVTLTRVAVLSEAISFASKPFYTSFMHDAWIVDETGKVNAIVSFSTTVERYE
jgi:hypothetical protein